MPSSTNVYQCVGAHDQMENATLLRDVAIKSSASFQKHHQTLFKLVDKILLLRQTMWFCSWNASKRKARQRVVRSV